MSIATEISRLQTAKANIKAAIEDKGVTVPSSATLDTYNSYIAAIQTGVGDHLHTIQKVTEGGVTTEQEVLVERSSTYTTIPQSTFQRNANIVALQVPPTVTSISNYAFYQCSSLYDVSPLKNITSIGEAAFSYASALTGILDCPNLTSLGNSAFRGTSISGIKNLGSITSISANMFQDNTSLIVAILPSTLTSIGNYAFYRCTNLKAVTLTDDSLTTIGSNAFQQVPAPLVIKQSTLTSLGSAAFQSSGVTKILDLGSITATGTHQYCDSLTEIVLPSTLTTITNYAFYKCTSLTKVTCKATTPPTLGSGAFGNCPIAHIYVPSASVSTYQSASGWTSYASIISAIT